MAEADADFEKQMARAVVKWLEAHPSKVEELEVAVQCISESFGIQTDATKYDTGVDLGEVFRTAVRAKRDSARDTGADDDEKLIEFIDILKGKGYFKGTEEGTPEYQERYEKAKQKYNARNNPYFGKTPEELKGIGNDKMKAGHYKEALGYYTKAIEGDPNNAVYFSNRAAAHQHLKEYAKAIQDCEQSVAIDPSYSKAYSRMGTAYFYQSQYSKAVETYAKALELDPDNEGYKADLAAAEEKAKEEQNQPPGMGGFPGLAGLDMSQLGNMMGSPEFMKLANNLMANPQFTKAMGDMFQNMTQTGQAPDFSQLMGEGNPLANIDPEQLQQLKDSPPFKDNPKFQAIVDDVKANGPSAIMKYMGDPEIMAAASQLVETVMKPKQDGDGDDDSPPPALT